MSQDPPATGTPPPGRRAPEEAPSPVPREESHPSAFWEWVRREWRWFDAFLKRWTFRFVIIAIHLVVALMAIYFVVWGMARGKTYDRVEDVPPRICGLVLGTTPKVGTQDNLFFKSRMKAAADLIKASKVQFLIVSGDNSRNGYDEPSEMKAALIALGVPANRIYCDYAGFRTLDSVVRARRIFGQVEFTIISQKYHNERALYIAQRHGLPDCVAYNAPDVAAEKMLKQYVRELGARVMAILDVEFLKTEPKFLGKTVYISEKSPPVDANPLPKR